MFRTGTARDCTGPLCLDYIEFDPVFAAWPTLDERLGALLSDIRHWCAQHGIRTSTVEDLSTLVFHL